MRGAVSVFSLFLMIFCVEIRGEQVEREPSDAGLVLELPTPSGPYSIGSRRYHWTDTTRKEGATDTVDDHRELFVQIWYPSAPSSEDREAISYFRHLEAYAKVFSKERMALLRRVRTGALKDAAFDLGHGRFPVLLFNHGWSAQVATYTILLQDLASHGYVVVAIDQPFQGRIAMPDGSVTSATEAHFADPMEMVTFYGQDQEFILDRLQALDRTGPMSGSLDLNRVGSIGHSNGALATLQIGKTDARIRAVAALDSWDPIFESVFKLDVPLLLVRTGGAQRPSAAFTRSQSGLFVATLKGGDHLSALDLAFIQAKNRDEKEKALHSLTAIRRVLVGFFDMWLRKSGTNHAETLNVPDLEIETFAPGNPAEGSTGH